MKSNKEKNSGKSFTYKNVIFIELHLNRILLVVYIRSRVERMRK